MGRKEDYNAAATPMGPLSPPLDAAQIQRIIPHRYPFLLVDRILEIEPGKRVVGIKNVSAADPFLQAYVPAEPRLPTTLLVEAMAQVGAVGVLADPAHSGQVPLFGGIDNCSATRSVRPGETVRMETVYTAMRGQVGKGHARAWVGDELVCEADLTFAFVDLGLDASDASSRGRPDAS